MNRFLVTAAAVFSLTASAWAVQPVESGSKTEPQRTEQSRAPFHERAQERFRKADKDGDGALTKAEAELGAPRLAKHFDAVDTNKDGKITQDELRAYGAKRHAQSDLKHRDGRTGHRDPEASKARLAAHFKQADTDGDGTLSRIEAEKAMPRIARHFDAIDSNHDGKVTPEEITVAVDKHRADRKKFRGDQSGPQGGKV